MKKFGMVLFCAAVTSAVFVGCGDEEEQPRPVSGGVGSSSSSSAASSSSSSSGDAGAGGMGGMASSSSSNSSSSNGSSSSGMGGMGGSGGGDPGINGCVQATAFDLTGMDPAIIQFAGLSYDPPCARVKVGSKVTFEGTFGLHPLQGGEVKNGVPTPDAMSPITPTSMGMSATFTMSTVGTYPYYCSSHALSGMKGAIFVEP